MESRVLRVPKRDWKNMVPDGVVVRQQSEWGHWSGIQLIHMAHRMRRFEIHSNYHALLVYLGQPSKFTLSHGSRNHQGTMKDNDVSFFSAHSIYLAECDGNVNEDIGLKIDPVLLEKFAGDESLHRGPLELRNSIAGSDPKTAEIIKLLNDDLAAGSPNGNLFGDCLMAALSANLIRLYGGAATEPSAYIHALDPLKLKKIEEFVEANLSANIKLADIAATVGYSPYHLHRLFKNATGERLHEYVIKLRVRRATELLKATHLPVSVIAVETGFTDASHLARNFRRVHAHSPAEYRAKNAR